MAMHYSVRVTRRSLLAGVGVAALAGHASSSWAQGRAGSASAFPLSAVRLKPSIFLDAVNTNRAYLLSLDPDRLLHNFRKGSGLAPKGELYGGWEARGIAGHTLGHYLSACALDHAQTGNPETRAHVAYILEELALCQDARGDGYVGGTTVMRDGQEVDGQIVYEEVRRGEIRSDGFGLNGGWVPIYSWHKVHAGLLDAHALCGEARALEIARGMGDYLIGVFSGLSDEQVQSVLVCEHGGINETFAELYARTGDHRYLELGERLYHRAVLEPIAAGRDQLAGLHANTQIPKVIGLARLHEAAENPSHAQAARFFWDTVVHRHSYAIGGNSEREFFSGPGVTASLLTDRTCEACNTYNMMRLTRSLWSWRQDSAYFDYYERAHLNHIMAHQHPETGMKVYFMPLSVAGRRQYSSPTGHFWCCVGSGMESHAKHGESIYWRTADTMFVNLFIPSSLEWEERGLRFDMDTSFPYGDVVNLNIAEGARAQRFEIAMRLPGWCASPTLSLNGRPVTFERRDGYAFVRRRWRAGDRLSLTVPMTPRVESAPDDARVVTFANGPLVLAADLGAATPRFEQIKPALEEGDALAALSIVDARNHEFTLAARPGALTLKPFFSLYERRTAPYLTQVSDTEWAEREAQFAVEAAERAALDARTIDTIQLGERASEAAHNYRALHDDLFSFEGVAGRQAAWGEGNYFEFDLAVERGPVTLMALYWGQEVNKDFEIKIDGEVLIRERRARDPQRAFVSQSYPLPARMTRGKQNVTVRVETRSTDAMVYEMRTLRGAA